MAGAWQCHSRPPGAPPSKGRAEGATSLQFSSVQGHFLVFGLPTRFKRRVNVVEPSRSFYEVCCHLYLEFFAIIVSVESLEEELVLQPRGEAGGPNYANQHTGRKEIMAARGEARRRA